VVVDALFSDSQAYAKATFRPTANQLFTLTNFYSFLIIAGFSLLVEGSFWTGLQFLLDYP
jgi:hypothetical protein